MWAVCVIGEIEERDPYFLHAVVTVLQYAINFVNVHTSGAGWSDSTD
jgi:hypothetical protein